ncbi:MAG: nucleotidyltransferase domain-containing protein [Planctomycetota bacterium]
MLQDLAEKIISRLKQESDIIAAYLFGSAAKNRTTLFSDIDVAVLLNPALPENMFTDFKIDLALRLSRLLDKNVDLVILNNAPPPY